MDRRYHRLLLLFVDGIGLAASTGDNPLATASSPRLRRLLGGALAAESIGEGGEWILNGIDACLGVEGLPQSATGQATLFCGVNAAAFMGRHVTGFPGPRIRSLIDNGNVVTRAVASGSRVAFANAYGADYLERLASGRASPSVSTCVMRSGGVRLRTTADLAAGRAVTWDIEGDLFGSRAGDDVERIEAVEAGCRLADLAQDYDLTVFETFLTDLAGHRRLGIDAERVVERLDGLLAGVLAADGDLTVLMTSDHGNLESRASRSHTRNSVPLLAIGGGCEGYRQVRTLQQVAPAILAQLATGEAIGS